MSTVKRIKIHAEIILAVESQRELTAEESEKLFLAAEIELNSRAPLVFKSPDVKIHPRFHFKGVKGKSLT